MDKPNIKKLTDYINSQRNPELFAAALFALAGKLREDEVQPKK